MAHPVLPTGGVPVAGDLGHLNHHDELHGRFNNSVEVLSGTTAARPLATAVEAGTLYWDTTLTTMLRSDGAVWTALASVTDHGALTGLADDDHPQYLTAAEGNAAYEAIGAVATHAAAGDPHTGYRLESADHSHQSTGLQGGQLDHGLALTGLADDDHTQYHTAARHAAVDAADHGSGASADGTVLTSDGAGGAAWEAISGGDVVYAEGNNTEFDVSETTDVTVFTTDITGVAVGDTVTMKIKGVIKNDSGSGQTYTFTPDFDGQFVPSVAGLTITASATSRGPFIIEASLTIESTSDARFHGWGLFGPLLATGAWNTVGAAMQGWDTAAVDLTGTVTCTLKVKSSAVTPTQTLYLLSVEIRKNA